MSENKNRVLLKPADVEDIQFLCDVECNTEIWFFSDHILPNRDEHEKALLNRINSDDHFSFIIELNDGKNTPIGRINIWSYKKANNSWEISYVVLPEYRQKGYGTEAAKLVLEFAFGYLKAHKVVATCNGYNSFSVGVLEAVGMTREAVLREEMYWNDQWVDQFYFSILDREYGA